jgi:hypothetical protein
MRRARFHNSKADSSSQSDAQNLKFARADWTSFRTAEGLQQKAGVPQHKFIRLVLKELADNGLDTGPTWLLLVIVTAAFLFAGHH